MFYTNRINITGRCDTIGEVTLVSAVKVDFACVMPVNDYIERDIVCSHVLGNMEKFG